MKLQPFNYKIMPCSIYYESYGNTYTFIESNGRKEKIDGKSTMDGLTNMSRISALKRARLRTFPKKKKILSQLSLSFPQDFPLRFSPHYFAPSKGGSIPSYCTRKSLRLSEFSSVYLIVCLYELLRHK